MRLFEKVLVLLAVVVASEQKETFLFPKINGFLGKSDNDACNYQSEVYREHLENLTLWAHEIWDASAKYTTGLLRGSLYQMGDWHECVTVKAPFQTQYCLATLKADVPPPNPPRDPLSLFYSPFEQVLNRIYKNEDVSQKSRDVIKLGLCVPASCSGEDLEDSLNSFLQTETHYLDEFNVSYSVKVDEEFCQNQDEQNYFDSWDIAFCFVCLILVLLVAFSTIFDYAQSGECDEKPHQKSLSSRLFVSFSLGRNFWDLSKSEDSNSALKILYGLRTYSICMIIMDHRFGTFVSAPVSNFDYVEEQYRSKFAAYIFHGDLFVDTFFTMSGLLVTYALLVQFDKKIINPFFIIFLRYIRLTPVYAFVILYYTSVFNHIGSGPMWKAVITPEMEDCRNNWWTNLLYISNYVNDRNMCLVHSWYLPCDFHYFIIAIAVTRITKNKRTLGLGLLVVLFIVSCLIPFVITVAYMRPALLQFYPFVLEAVKQSYDFQLTYTKSHTRAEPYIVGMFAGYLYYRLKDNNKKLSRLVSHVLTAVSLLVIFASIATGSIFYNRYYEYSAIQSGLYAALHRVTWAAGTCGVLFCMSYGHADVLRSILSWSVWIPLAKLSYGAYLMHMQFQLRQVGMTTAPRYFTYFDVISLSFGDMVLAFAAALLLHLAIEAPLRRIFKELLTPTKQHKPNADENHVHNQRNNDSRL